MTAEQRSGLYVFMVAVIGLALVYGLVSGEQAEAWTRVAEALVNAASIVALLIARRYVPEAPRRGGGDDAVTDPPQHSENDESGGRGDDSPKPIV